MSETTRRPIRLGMVGGGQGAFIGAVHRIAARIDGHYELVAGALSSRPEVAAQSAHALGIAAERAYESFETMATAEAARDDGIDAVAIVTPNHMHFPAAKAFLEAGIHVICDKPITSTLEDARALRAVTAKNGAKFLLTHNYTGYPLMRQARRMVEAGELGTLRVVQMEYPQDGMTVPADPDNKQASWRTDPQKAGAGGCIGDIGTHAYNLMRFVTGLETESLSADLMAFVTGRQVDDNVHVMLRFKSGARGMLWASQVAVGNENGLKLRVYGDKGGLEWGQENPNHLWFTPFGKPSQLLTRGGPVPGVTDETGITRVPPGHPEGYLEAFATLYTDFAAVLRGQAPANVGLLPTLDDGVEGMAFIAAAVRSSREDGKWTRLSDV